MKLNNITKEQLDFIKNEITSGEIVIYQELMQKFYDKFGISIYRQQLTKIFEMLGIDYKKEKTNYTRHYRELDDLSNEAEKVLGITSEEIFLAKTLGYRYSEMCEVFHKLTGKYIWTTYFVNKYISFCKENNYPIPKGQRTVTPKDLALVKKIMENMQISEFSKFFIELKKHPPLSQNRGKKEKMQEDSANNSDSNITVINHDIDEI